MNFDVYGGFEIKRKKNGHGMFDKDFWHRVNNSDLKLSGACGCYVFALRHGKNIVAWYVGKTEKNTFEKECFQATKINYYNEVLADHIGTPVLYLLPRLTSSESKFSKPTSSGYRDIDFLETMLIGMALERNGELMNVKKTKLLRDIVVKGIINSSPGNPTSAIKGLKIALGL